MRMVNNYEASGHKLVLLLYATMETPCVEVEGLLLHHTRAFAVAHATRCYITLPFWSSYYVSTRIFPR
jgi:hypothetical protein